MALVDIALVGLGGCLGAIARYLVGRLLIWPASALNFPIGTLVVNVVGCFVIGALAQAGETRSVLSPQARLFLMTGILGGFTTFSAFGNETVLLMRGDQFSAALINTVIHIVLGLAAVFAGRALVSVVAH